MKIIKVYKNLLVLRESSHGKRIFIYCWFLEQTSLIMSNKKYSVYKNIKSCSLIISRKKKKSHNQSILKCPSKKLMTLFNISMQVIPYFCETHYWKATLQLLILHNLYPLLFLYTSKSVLLIGIENFQLLF